MVRTQAGRKVAGRGVVSLYLALIFGWVRGGQDRAGRRERTYSMERGLSMSRPQSRSRDHLPSSNILRSLSSCTNGRHHESVILHPFSRGSYLSSLLC